MKRIFLLLLLLTACSWGATVNRRFFNMNDSLANIRANLNNNGQAITADSVANGYEALVYMNGSGRLYIVLVDSHNARIDTLTVLGDATILGSLYVASGIGGVGTDSAGYADSSGGAERVDSYSVGTSGDAIPLYSANGTYTGIKNFNGSPFLWGASVQILMSSNCYITGNGNNSIETDTMAADYWFSSGLAAKLAEVTGNDVFFIDSLGAVYLDATEITNPNEKIETPDTIWIGGVAELAANGPGAAVRFYTPNGLVMTKSGGDDSWTASYSEIIFTANGGPATAARCSVAATGRFVTSSDSNILDTVYTHEVYGDSLNMTTGQFQRIRYDTNYSMAYGEIYNHADDSTLTLTAESTWYEIDLDSTGLSFQCSVRVDSNYLKPDITGTFKVYGTISFSGTANTPFEVACFVDGTEQENVHCERKLNAGGDIGNCGIHGIVKISAGSKIKFFIRSIDGAGKSAIIQDATFGIHKLGP